MPEHQFHLVGDVDIARSSDLEAKLLVLVNATKDDLVIDCNGLEFIDSTGIGILLHTKRLLATHERDLRVINLTGMAKRCFEVVGLIELFGIDASESTGV